MTATVGPFYVGDNPAVDLHISVTRNDEALDLAPYDNATVQVFDPAGETIVWDATITIDQVNDWVVVPFPDVSPLTEAGYYTLYVQLVDGTNTETADPVMIQVLALTNTTAWATISDVANVTGSSVSNATLLDANEIIQIFSGRTTATPRTAMKARDLEWLKKAVAWQAAWLPEQPGYKARHWIKEIIQDGTNIVYVGSSEPANPAMVALAPLAARALKNLSWMAGRSIKLRYADVLGSGFSYEEYKRNDDHGGWQPL
jgi:hypothetical protein